MSLPRPFGCPFCSQSFTRSENLERHKRSRHGASGSKHYECPLCHAVFNRRDICKRHRERCDGRPPSQRMRRTEIIGTTESTVVNISKTSPSKSPSQQVDQPGPGSAAAQTPSPAPARSSFPEEAIPSCIAAYFANFHPNLPILHRPTFSLTSTPKAVMNIIVAIGNLYHCHTDPTVDIETAHQQSNELWEASIATYQATRNSEPERCKEVWVLQTVLLCVVYGAFGAERFAKSRELLASLVSDIREFGLFHQHMLGCPYSAWRQELDSGMLLAPLELNDLWRSFVTEESMKLCLYGITTIDFNLALACNTREEISPLELVWDLPWSKKSWEADTTEDWWQHMSQEASSYQTIDGAMSDRGPAMKSLFLATQALLSDSPPASLLRALSSSQFALFCVTANIYRLVRGFTHHLYQLPPNPANPSPFHMLTHSQNSQITSALKTITGLRSAEPSIDTNDEGLWDAIDIFCWVTKISLCVPDDFLICGIVDTDITAAFAKAAHLSLGNQILGRRSRSIITTPLAFGEEGFLLIFEELMNALNTIVCSEAQKVVKEAPWVSVVGFRVLLDLYRVLRLATRDIHERNVLRGMSATRTFDPAQVVHNTVHDAVARHIRTKWSLLTPRDLEQLSLLELTEDPKVCERKLMMVMIQSCHERNVWAVGRGTAMVLEELSASQPP